MYARSFRRHLSVENVEALIMVKIIQWAAREKRRAVNEAVGRDFFKTLTEPLTNADSIERKNLAVLHVVADLPAD
jgi:hypothetical protein